MLGGLIGTLDAPDREPGLDAVVNDALEPVAEGLSDVVFYEMSLLGAQVPLVVLWLVLGAAFFTVYFRFINLRALAQAGRIVRGDYSNPDEPGEVSHFQALATALSGTVGIGNIGAVAVAVTVGGPGATVWLIVAGFLGMSTKFVECTLAVHYRQHNADGTVSGGPMYYLREGIGRLGYDRAGRFLGAFYAGGIVIACMGVGNMFQSNQAYAQLVQVTGGDGTWLAQHGWAFGLVLALVVGVVVIGGIRSIARVTETLVPLMALLYLSLALLVIAFNAAAIPGAVALILDGAFTAEGVAGGALGAMVVGFQRAVFSNEAGVGSAAIAHSSVRTKEPVTEGLVSLLEPLIDTVIICTITALVIATTRVAAPGYLEDSGAVGIAMTSAALERQLDFAPVALSIAAMLFAFSTIISWSYYGLKGWTYLVGEGRGADLGFKAVYCGFVALGCTLKLDAILKFSDAMVFVICVPNILGLYLLAPEVKRLLGSYRARVDSGEIRNYRNAGRDPASSP